MLSGHGVNKSACSSRGSLSAYRMDSPSTVRIWGRIVWLINDSSAPCDEGRLRSPCSVRIFSLRAAHRFGSLMVVPLRVQVRSTRPPAKPRLIPQRRNLFGSAADRLNNMKNFNINVSNSLATITRVESAKDRDRASSASLSIRRCKFGRSADREASLRGHTCRAISMLIDAASFNQRRSQ